ncbi:MAG: biopolymer transporter ExbD [Planctomycetota bacterium]
MNGKIDHQSGNVTDASRNFRLRRRRRCDASTALTLNLVPMIDVTFQLLIFFAIGSTFEKPEGLFAADLQRASRAGQTVALPISPTIIRLTPTGQGCRLRIDNFTKAPASFGDLTVFLKELQGNPGFDDQTPVVIIADDELTWDHVVGCWNAAVRASCKHIAFGSGQ